MKAPGEEDVTSLCTCFCGVTWKGNYPQVTCQGRQMGNKNSMGCEGQRGAPAGGTSVLGFKGDETGTGGEHPWSGEWDGQ